MRFLVSASVLLVLLVSAAVANSVDVVASFPASQGENGFWAQAYNPDTGIFRDLSSVYLSGTDEWIFGTPGQPLNMPKMQVTAGGVKYLPAWQRPIYGTEWPVLSYVVPVSGYYAVTGSFSNANATGCSTRGVIFVNGSANDPLFSGNVTKTESAQFEVAGLYLNQGDYLRFGLDSLGVDAYDNTYLNALILSGADASAVPEPGSLAALAVGLVGLVTMRRRKR